VSEAPRPRARRLVVQAHAKLNLGLAVGPRRRDGFHDLASIFQSVSLADTLELRPRARGVTLTIRTARAAARGTEPRVRLPRGPRNLVVRAARLLAAHDRRVGGVAITLTKRIPVESGLGGGSADAAAAVIGTARLYGVRLSPSVRRLLALELGSDVPFAIDGGTALVTGRGERLRKLRLARRFHALIALPRWRVSTARAYAKVDLYKKHLTLWRSNLRFAQVLARERVIAANAMRLGNTFETVVQDRRRDVSSLRARLIDAGAVSARMTGSGSAVFGIFERRAQAAAAIRRFAGDETLYVARSEAHGLRLTPQP
jgi:4-diphosphocytidyl-2-C-methyl-D-erythritol kinase